MKKNIRKEKKLDISKCLKEYKALKELYKDFSYTVKCLLENLLCEHDFKYHTVAYREKGERSLRDKLEKNQNIKSLKDIDDLAGCRIIFYLNDSIERVIGYLQKEFKVVKRNSKYSDDGYNAFHLIIQLKKDRLNLNEYKRFVDLKCEIQLTTVLFHAWAEIEHDIIYKPEKSLLEFSKPSFKKIESLFSDIMKKHIKEAQYGFDFIAIQMEDLKRGKEIFDTFLQSLAKSKTNNEIYQRLDDLLKYVKKFNGRLPKQLNIVKVINDTLKTSEQLKKVPITYPWGDYPGMDYSHVAKVCLDILEYLIYAYPKEVFEILTRLSIDKDNEVKEKSLGVISKMAEYTFWPKAEKIYYHPQIFILDETEKWNNKKLLTYLDLIIKVTEGLLSPDFKGLSWDDHKTFVIHQGVLPAGDTIEKIRERTINILKKIYSLSGKVSNKQRVLKAIEKATHLYFHKNTKEFKKIVIDNTNSVILLYFSIVHGADNEILQIIERDLYWFKKRFPRGLKGVEELQSVISKNKEYQIYKLFVGWEHPSLIGSDWDKIEKARKEQINLYLKQITQGQFPRWKKRILSIIKNYEHFNDKGQYYHFGSFLQELGKQKPQFADKLISENEEELKPFLINLLAGMWRSSQKRNAKKILRSWIRKGKLLPVCGLIFDYVREIDESLIQKVYKKAKEKGDLETFNNIIRSIVGNSGYSQVGKNLFIGCISELEKHKFYSWVNYIFLRRNAILKASTKNDWRIILKNLIRVPDINHQLEEILSVVAKKYPKELINFFYKRVKTQEEKKQADMTSIYEAIPFQLHVLANSLKQHSKLIVEEVFKWFQEKKTVYHWEGARFLQVLFIDFHQEIEFRLIELIKSGNKENIRIVLNVLRSYKYKNTIVLHNVCKELIKKYPVKYQDEMFIILSQTGVVSGEYGFMKNYERKKQEIQEWKKDKSRAIKNFVTKYERHLSQYIKYEKKRAEENIAMRKRKFENQD